MNKAKDSNTFEAAKQMMDRLNDIRNTNSGDNLEVYQKIIDGLKNKIIPEQYPETDYFGQLDMGSLMLRDELIAWSGYALVAYEWVRPLSKWIGKRKCLEIMSGSGILSKALQDCSVDIIATDNQSWSEKAQSWFVDSFTEVEDLDCVKAIEKYGNDMDIIVCSWPPYEEDTAYKALQKMREVNPNLVMIYIGEGEGGATANDAFHNKLEYVEDSGFVEAVKDFKRCYGLHDHPCLVK